MDNATLAQFLEVTQDDVTTAEPIKCLYPGRFRHGKDMNTVVFVFLCPILGLICLLGLFGNTLSFIVMHKEKHPNSSTFLLKALAVADNFVLIFFIIFFVLPSIYDYTLALPAYYDFFMLSRNYTSFGLWFSKTISVYIVVIMTVERYIAVCKPFRAVDWCTMRNAKIGLCVVIIFALGYNMPKCWYYQNPVYVFDPCFGYERPFTFYTKVAMTANFQYVYVIGLYFAVVLVTPLVILIVLNLFLIRAVQNAKTTRGDMVSAGKAKKGDNITEKIIGVVTAFIVLESPAFIFNVAYLISSNKSAGTFIDLMLRLMYVLSATNSFINFYIYCLVGKKFRRQVVDTLTCVGPGSRLSGSTWSMSQSISSIPMSTAVPIGNSSGTLKNGNAGHENGVNGVNGRI